MTPHNPSYLDALAALLAAIGPLNLVYAFIAINLLAFAAFGIDKARAETGSWRVKETTLLTLAFLGGSPGAFAGRAVFRHKTRKQPFTAHLAKIAMLQAIALGTGIGWNLPG